MRSIPVFLGLFLFSATLLAPLSADCRTEDGDNLSPYAATLLEQINTYRVYYGLTPLRPASRLNRLARTHSFDMYRQKRMSHSGFNERFRRSGSRLCVENVGWNYSAPLKQFDAWRHSRGHDENMLNDQVRYAGISQVGKYVTFFACR